MDGLLVYDLVGGQCPPHPGLKTVAGHVFWPHGKSEFFIDVCYQEELSILSIFHRCVRLYVDLWGVFCSKRQLTQDFHRLRNTSTVEFKFRPDSAVPTTTHTKHDESFNATKNDMFHPCRLHVSTYPIGPAPTAFWRFCNSFDIHCPATGKFRTDGSISGLMVRAVWLVV